MRLFLSGLVILPILIYCTLPERQTASNSKKAEEIPVVPNPQKSDEIVATDLEIPWEIIFLPDGEILVTERTGTVIRLSDRKRFSIEDVRHIGEGGLLGMTLHPDFENNNWIYLYLTTGNVMNVSNKVVRYRYEDGFKDRHVILEDIPGNVNHNGGRIAFGPDGYLYITTGDAGNRSKSQDINSLAGKILRIEDDGGIPSDNPFNNAVWSWGHRNPQGLAWDKDGRLWAAEHGRSGLSSGMDEINLIKKGQNYGWPIIEGDEMEEDMVRPVIHSGADITWAPAGMAYFNGSLFFGGLRGATLYEARINNDLTISSIRSHYKNDFGRIRAVKTGSEGYLYITTSNTDGRGDPDEDDDKIIRIKMDELITKK